MQFYKEREFGELLSDTFDFVKQYGKNYFKNYIVINGLIILLLLVVFYFGFGDLFQQFFGSNLQGQQFYFEDYFQQNQLVLALSFLLLFVIYMLFSIINYSYPIFYLQRVSGGDNQEVTVNQIVHDIKANIGKIFMFFIGMLFIIMPIMFIIMLISGLLMFLIIGFFLIILIIPAALNVINLAFYHYLQTEAGFFESLSYGFNAQFSKAFWKYWGSTVLIYILLQIVASVFSFIPLFFGISGSLLISPDSLNNDTASMIFMTLIYGLSFVVSITLSNLIYINGGLIYYDSRKDLHRDVQLAEIENIGTGEV